MVKRHSDASEPGIREPGRVVVLYEDVATREFAASASPELSHPPAEGGELIIQWCSFDGLADSRLAQDAAAGAASADLIIFAMNPGGDLPVPVKLWIETWISRRSEREGVLVGVVLPHRPLAGTEVACLKEIYLRQAAHHAGMDYLCHVPAALRQAIPDSLDSYGARADQVTSVLDEILRSRFPPPTIRR
jgi:hypothetical protein